ncbi:hypothetical protein T02_1720 [Trichinella nativa]|uniref:Uncharacterized protein n=1 Tax=Trichinella nativa TaxID=6335 RepID=A0A0V1KZ97_9BILA|nr:hypothetical protein T02_1720 [Trichinella nativa]
MKGSNLLATYRKCVVDNRAVCDSMKSDDLGKPQEVIGFTESFLLSIRLSEMPIIVYT